jgi:phospholipid-binding lipoprotein MlaA
MKLLPGLILVSVLMLYPAMLKADTSMTNRDTSHAGGSFMFITHQTVPDTLSDGTPATEDSISPATQARIEEIMLALAEKNSAEEKANESAGQVEDEKVSEDAQAEGPQIADPLAPVNRVMFHFNDKLYFWGIKPVTQVYSHVIPEDFRFAISNVYDNLWAPSRMLNNLFQLRIKAAGNELVRFVFNSFAGVGGMGDMASEALNIKKQDADFGQTLGHYGMGHGIYLVLPVFGPSSIRDGIGLAGDQLMYPLTYIRSVHVTFGERAGIFAHEKVNATSFKIGDYESFKEAAIDPYVSMRDAFVQNRLKKVEESRH